MAKIRGATVEDLPALLILGKRFVAEYVPDLPLDEDVTERTLRFLLDPANILLVATANSTVVGAIGFAVTPHPLCDFRVASELFWYVAREARGIGAALLLAAEGLAATRGARKMHMIALASNPSVGDLYLKLDYRLRESSYEKDL